MRSIFSPFDSQTFWQKAPKECFFGVQKDLLFKSYLYLLSDSGFTRNLIVLAKNKLFKIGALEEVQETSVTWKTIEPFTETRGQEVRYGFRLKGSDSYEDFYTKDSFLLENWISALNGLCVFNDIQYDYAFVQYLAKHEIGKSQLAKSFEDSKVYYVQSFCKRKLPSLGFLKFKIESLRKVPTKLHKVYESKKFVHLILDLSFIQLSTLRTVGPRKYPLLLDCYFELITNLYFVCVKVFKMPQVGPLGLLKTILSSCPSLLKSIK